MPKDRPAARQTRRDGRRSNHEPFLRLVKEEVTRRPVRPIKREIAPLNEAQRRYVNAITINDVTFGIGPAGTGKTWLAAQLAARALDTGIIERIVVTRPVCEAEDEELGFLPGDINEKIEPYFRPVREPLEEYFGSGHLEYLIKAGVIEARPMAYLRGATFKNCWVLGDEMQNATQGQHKLLLSRIGENTKMIINGDPSQTDPKVQGRSGLLDAVRRFHGKRGFHTVRFDREDIVRSGICRIVVDAYEEPLAANDPGHERYNESIDADVRHLLSA